MARKTSGLSTEEASRSREKHGANTLPEKKRRSFFSRFASNLADPIIRILIGAMILNVCFSAGNVNWFETAGIAASILIATLVSTLSECGSERAFERLSAISGSVRCRAMRDGVLTELAVSDVVVGDVILLSAGETVPADGILLSGCLSVDQAALNGESAECEKRAAPDETVDEGTLDSPRHLFRGSLVASGEGVLLVTHVGGATLYGTVAAELQEESAPSPLKERLSVLASSVSFIGYVAAAMIAFAYLFNVFVIDNGFSAPQILADLRNGRFLFHEAINALTLAVTVIVVAVPEGLPMMITVVLSANMRKMTRTHVLVRKPVGIETAGSMNLLFTDKTGTLTEGKPRVSAVLLGDGTTYETLGALTHAPEVCRALAANARLNTSCATTGKRILGGNATERALLSFLAPYRLPSERVCKKDPFDSKKKCSRAVLESGEELFKGAPEVVFSRVDKFISASGLLLPLDHHFAERLVAERAAAGERVIAVASSRGGTMALAAIVAMRDGVRREAPSAVAELHRAGIGVVMVTGDGKATAEKIARDCGILTPDRPLALDGAELRRMRDADAVALLDRCGVIYRAVPSDKSRLVRLAHERGLVCGMTGDGMNDAPALKAADVGFAMGGGTDIAKEAGDIVILDDNISSIARAVLYGRTIFESIRKFIVFQLTMNFCALSVSLICPFLGVENPVTVIQMLWINIIMDTLGALAFAGEAPRPESMREPPKDRGEKILSGAMISRILLPGAYTVALSIAFLCGRALSAPLSVPSEPYRLSAFFLLFIFLGIFTCFNARTERIAIVAGLGKNKPFLLIMSAIAVLQLVFIKYGGELFRTVPLSSRDTLYVILLASTVIPLDICRKIVAKKIRLTLDARRSAGTGSKCPSRQTQASRASEDRI